MAPRVPHRVACQIRLAAPDGRTLQGRTINLSPGGLSVQVPGAVARDTVIDVWLPSVGGTQVQFRGMVVHTRRAMTDTYELGIRFMQAPAS